MLTGQISSHALQLVHAQISSAVIRSNSEFGEIVISRIDAERRADVTVRRRWRPSPRRP